MPHWAARIPLWVVAVIAASGFALLAVLIVRRKGLRAGMGQVGLYASVGAAGFGGSMIKYSVRVSLLLLAFGYPMLLLATGFQPHRLADMDELTRGNDQTAARNAKRYIWRFIAILLVETTAVFFLLGQPGVRN